jgi:two-component system C4-dicarboxylate transport sensor histidine kinase DctB
MLYVAQQPSAPERSPHDDARIARLMASRVTKRLLLCAAIGSVAVSAYVTQAIWKENGLRALRGINEQRVQLIANAVRAEINRQDHLPVLVALDKEVQSALTGPRDAERLAQLRRKLEHLSREADTRGLYVIAPDGEVIASDDWQAKGGLLGRNLSDRPYFKGALAHGRSAYLGIDPASGRVRYYLAEAVRNPDIVGVAVVRIEFDELEASWERAREHVLVTDKSGIVFLSSDAGYRFRPFVAEGASPTGRAGIADYTQPDKEPVVAEYVERRGNGAIIRLRATDDEESFLYQAIGLPEFGWTIHRLTDLDGIHADQRDGAIIGGALSALIIFLILYLIERHRAYLAAHATGELLKSEVAKRTHELRNSNLSLQTEIEERRRTEARLRAMQNELVQAGKLAALGQMSAAIAHEINQPLAAIRTFLASTKIFSERGEMDKVAGNLDIVNGLAERMARITAHLKTFARKSEPGHPEPVHVGRAVDGALFLLKSRIKAADAKVEVDNRAPDACVSGYAVQLEQVMLNLISNALDAVADAAEPWIGIAIRSDGGMVTIGVADNGSGIAPELLNRIFDPFVTSKPVGQGLGLGLSISYGIVQDFHGSIRAANRAEGGAELTVELPAMAAPVAVLTKALHV